MPQWCLLFVCLAPLTMLASSAGNPGDRTLTVETVRFVSADVALRVGRRLRRAVIVGPTPPPALFGAAAGRRATRRPAVPALASSLVHAVLLVVAILLTSMAADSAPAVKPNTEPARLVFVVSPGPGGGGGGGGLRNPLPARRVERKAPVPRPAVSVPAVAPLPAVAPAPPKPEPPPPPPQAIVAPVVETAGDRNDRDGAIDDGAPEGDSQGQGTGGGAGTGHGTGSGEGLGSGIGEGSGGGTGGGPYRPGSGIEPPRLLREVKAEYTDEGRRRGVSGDVLLEIVVRRDGSVGDVRLLRGLGAGLDQRAVQAVRQWRFSPARRLGAAVDVLVEVAVEFMLR